MFQIVFRRIVIYIKIENVSLLFSTITYYPALAVLVIDYPCPPPHPPSIIQIFASGRRGTDVRLGVIAETRVKYTLQKMGLECSRIFSNIAEDSSLLLNVVENIRMLLPEDLRNF